MDENEVMNDVEETTLVSTDEDYDLTEGDEDYSYDYEEEDSGSGLVKGLAVVGAAAIIGGATAGAIKLGKWIKSKIQQKKGVIDVKCKEAPEDDGDYDIGEEDTNEED